MTVSVLDDCQGIAAVFRPSDIIPAIHLSNLAGNQSATLCIIGDSTTEFGIGVAQSIDTSQVIWSALTTEFARQNPRIIWNFQRVGPIQDDPGRGNYGVGGTWFGDFLKPVAELDPNCRQPWFTDLSKTWLSYVKAAQPDVLMVCTGINYAEQGTVVAPHAHNLAHHLKHVLLEIATWDKVPNIIFITNKVAHSAIIGPPDWLEYQRAVAAAIRTFCRSSGRSVVNSPGLTASQMQQFGLIDIGRHFCSHVIGYDYDCQYMARQPPAIAHRVQLGSVPTEIGTTRDGDFAMTLEFPRQSGPTMSSQLLGGGTGQLMITFGPYLGNGLTLDFASETLDLAYSVIGDNSSRISLRNGPVTLPMGNLTIGISCKSEHVVVLINRDIVFDELVPRFICGGVVTIAAKMVPSAYPTMVVNSFLSGFAMKSPISISENAFWGAYGTTEFRYDGPYGGNNINHSSSIGMVLDYEIIGASNLAAPCLIQVPPTIPDPGTSQRALPDHRFRLPFLKPRS